MKCNSVQSLPIPVKTDRSAEERKVLSKLLVDEGDIIASLAEQVEKVKRVFRIENPTGRVIFENFGQLGSDAKRVSAVLLGKYFARRLRLIEDDSMGVSEIAHELGRPMTALSGPLADLVKDGSVERLPVRKYRIVYHRIPAIIDNLTEKRERPPSLMEILNPKGAKRG
jgi:AAA+ ATPase superfamily predicted ATPase